MKKCLVIAPYEAQRILFKKYRQEDLFSDIKFISKEELIANCFYDYSLDAVKFLVKNYHLNFKTAKAYLRVIIYLGEYNSKYDYLFKIKEELLTNNLLIKNELFKYELENSDTHVAYYSEFDPDIKRCLSGFTYAFDKLESFKPESYLEFERNDGALFYAFNEIEKLLLNNVPANKIVLYGLKDDDKTIFDRLVNNYSLNVNNAYSKKLVNLPEVRRFVETYSGNLDAILLGFECNDDYKEQLVDSIKEYYIDGLDVTSQKDFYKDAFSTIRVKGLVYNEALRVVNEPIIDEDEYLFIFNFAQGVFPRSYKDVDFIDDKDKKELNVPSSDEYNVMSVDYYKHLLGQKGHISLIFSKSNFSSKMMPSQYKGILGLKAKDDTTQYEVYSLKEARLQMANLLDLERKYLFKPNILKAYKEKLDIPYRNYDSSYNGAKHYSGFEHLELSYSQVKNFCECQYKYYLNKVLKLDELETKFNITLGKILHRILQNLDKYSDYNISFEESVDHFKGEIEPSDLIFLRRIKDEFKKTYDFIRDQEKATFNGSFKREASYVVELPDNISLKGIFDKVILSGENKQYLSIVDYKSGSETFKEDMLPYGLSLQLPTYALMASLDSSLSDKELICLGIQTLFAKSVGNIAFDDIDKYRNELKLKGVYLDSKDAIKTIAGEFIDGKPEFLSSYALSKNDADKYSGKVKVYSKEQLDAFAQSAEALILNAGNSIRNNEFTINPKIIKGKNKSCENCPFRDICYRSNKDFIVLGGEEEEDED